MQQNPKILRLKYITQPPSATMTSPKLQPDYRASSAWEAMRDKWIKSIEKRFTKTVGKAWGVPLNKVGTFSNGEAVFQKKG